MGPTTLFGIIYKSYCIIQLTFTFIYSAFSKKFSISTKCPFDMINFANLFYYSTYFCYY